jgi:para-nitrobenzyl esterase
MFPPAQDTSIMPPEVACCDVDVTAGRLRGTVRDGVMAFKGIPYAAPPTGVRRFRPAAPPPPWDGVRMATAFAPAAAQPPDAGFYPDDPDAMPLVDMAEDCLFLNVWAPATPGPHPVLVWLHGGAQIVGGTARPVYDGAVFAARGIVCVTVGFRLGALGFLLPDDDPDSGGACLSDQAAALAWVSTNIAAFGGDPGRVTLGGESAGAKNIAALLAAPTASRLFQAAVLQSGGGETTHDVAAARAVTARFAATAGVAVAELTALPLADLLAAQQRLLAEAVRRFPFRPAHGTALLPAPPLAAVAAGSARGHALLIGTSRDELAPLVAEADLADGWRDGLLAHRSAADMAAIEARAATALPGLSAIERRRRLLVAEEYVSPSLRLAEAQARAGGAAWMYRFDLELPSGPLAGTAPHTADLSPTWRRASPYDALPGDPARALHEAIVRFVHRHDPGWPRYEAARGVTALIGRDITLAEHPGRALLDLFERTGDAGATAAAENEGVA